MKKISNLLLTFLAGLFAINVMDIVSAQLFGGYFSLSNFLNSITPQTMTILVVFIVTFGFLTNILGMYFKENKGTSGIISFMIALGITWSVNRSGYDLGNMFYIIGFSEDAIVAVLGLLFLGLFIWGVMKKRMGNVWMGTGALLIFASFTDMIYEKGVTIFLGAILLALGAWLMSKRPAGQQGQGGGGNP